jgi:hypothetical protein
MNYDILERDVLGYQDRMTCQSEHRRALRSVTPGPRALAARPARAVRSQLAVALRSFADRLDTGSARTA